MLTAHHCQETRRARVRDCALGGSLGDAVGRPNGSTVDDDGLVARFATVRQADPERGYGADPPQILATVLSGGDWRRAASASFDGAGPRGNGAATGAASVGALAARTQRPGGGPGR